MKRLLYVDDDPSLRHAMRNVLRRQRNVWDVVLAEGAAEAMAILERQPCDVIVSDLQMPSVGGVALLDTVKARFPAVVRILASGRADAGVLIEGAGAAHHFLSKPFTTESLLAVIGRSTEQRDALDSDPLRALIGRLGTLPSVPSAYLEITAAVAQGASAGELARIVERDPAMAAKVLQLVASAYFGLEKPMSSVARAVAYLGTEALKGLTLCGHLFQPDRPWAHRISLEHLQAVSVATARRAQAMLAQTPDSDAAFTAGLVHRVGQLALAAGLPAYDAVLAAAADGGRPLPEVELQMLGATHADVGGALLGLWGLPAPIVEAVARQHTPASVAHAGLDLTVALHTAAAIAAGSAPDLPLLTQLGLVDRLPAWAAPIGAPR